jgi:hypothetical protein
MRSERIACAECKARCRVKHKFILAAAGTLPKYMLNKFRVEHY